ncbi:unnamed protein product [Caenorhabditis auriculariae]|uniref:Uncharacterized protein n=1 Tax=Caenorhabditis auriculariae TaxID=2777116 RepID=A0A8S1GPP2_9PELO|nr:unnamed protein product [Caenorhabditis auriculariae]
MNDFDNYSTQELRLLAETPYVSAASVCSPFHDEESSKECPRGGFVDSEDLRNHQSRVEDIVLTESGDISKTAALNVRDAASRGGRDEALSVLQKLLRGNYESLEQAGSKKMLIPRWFGTSRDTEVALFEHILSVPRARPRLCGFPASHLEEEDIVNLIHNAVSPNVELPSVQTTVRISIKTDMSFSELVEQLDTLCAAREDFYIENSEIVAFLYTPPNLKERKSFKTADYHAYAELESLLEEPHHLMLCQATVTCSLKGRPYLQVCLSHTNAVKEIEGPRFRKMTLEQIARRPGRRVTIDESTNKVFEYELPEDARMIPLKLAVVPSGDLIEYLSKSALGQSSL